MGAGTKLPSAPHEISDLITDAARFAEGVLTEAAVRKKWRLNNAVWTALANNELFIEKIEAEKLRRIRTGAAKRELAQKYVVKGPDILDSIATDVSQSARHRVDAIKTLDVMSDTGPQAAQNSDERFIININLGNDTRLRFNKSIRPNPHDVDPDKGDVIEHAPLPAITAMNKRGEDNGGGNAL